MKGVLIGADFIRLAEQMKFLEINTDVDLFVSDVDYLELSNLFTYFSENGYTKLVLIYKTKHITSQVVDLFEQTCNTNGITLEKVIIPNNSITIPSITSESNTFYLRCAYDVTAIVDDTYCRDKSEVVKLLFDSNNADILPKTKVINSTDGLVYDNFDVISTNEPHPNAIVKKILPDFDKVSFPRFHKLDTNEELDTLKTNLDSSLILQEFKFDSGSITDDRICDVIRTWTILLEDVETMIYIGGHLTKNRLPLNMGTVTYENGILDNKWRTMYFSNPITVQNGVPGAYEVIQLVDGVETVTTMTDIAIGDTIKSLNMVGLADSASISQAFLWEATGSAQDIISYSTASVVGKTDIPWQGWLSELVYELDSTMISSSIAESEPVIVRDSIDSSIKFKQSIDIIPGDLLITAANMELPIIANNNLWYSGSLVTINIEPSDVYLAGTDLNNINIAGSRGLFVHNAKCSWCCFAADTLVYSEDDEMLIQNVKIGDLVWSYNFETNEKELKEVIGTTSPLHDNIIEIEFDNGTTIVSTTDHPFYNEVGELISYEPTATNQWYSNGIVYQMEVGSKCKFFNDNVLTITSIKKINEEIQTYTIFVEDNNNFYANGVLVFDEQKNK